jgi:hypothetical protein
MTAALASAKPTTIQSASSLEIIAEFELTPN